MQAILLIIMIQIGRCLRFKSYHRPITLVSWVKTGAQHRRGLVSFSHNGDTIYALSSGPLTKSGVAVVRLSGPESLLCYQKLVNSSSNFKPTPRVASLKSLTCPFTKDMIDKGIVIWFPSPKSFTGEDVIEFHLHGSRAVINSIFQIFERLNVELNINIRPAEPGEFSRRAFDNGKMDLTEVEGLADLLAAETSQQRKQALRQMEGHAKVIFEKWREDLLKCLAHTEAVIDFGDDDREGDINESAMEPLIPIAKRIRDEVKYHLADGRKGEIIREGIRVALVGQPNAGKSSLLNALARRPAAIVSPIAGTTRDIVEVRMDIDGHSCILRDTAGIRVNSTDIIEIEGIKRAREAFETSQLKIFVADVSTEEAKKDAATLFSELMSQGASNFLTVLNKVDLVDPKRLMDLRSEWIDAVNSIRSDHDRIIPVSCTETTGIERLERGISEVIASILQNDSYSNEDGVLITRERHRFHLRQCVYHLDRFVFEHLPMDAAAEEVRLAMMELGKITGRVDVEELLDIIFRDFCIGK